MPKRIVDHPRGIDCRTESTIAERHRCAPMRRERNDSGMRARSGILATTAVPLRCPTSPQRSGTALNGGVQLAGDDVAGELFAFAPGRRLDATRSGTYRREGFGRPRRTGSL